MRRLLAALFLVLAFGVAQRAELSVGSPFGLQGGVRFPLLPLLLDGRAYGGVGLEALGGGADLLLKLPLTDLYLGLGAFYGTGPALSYPPDGRGQGGLRAVLGTWLNLPLPLLGAYLEIHPTYYLAPTQGFGVGAAVGLSVGL
ncbi:hypothetical protein SAMN04488243_10435 [Thermus arciformis]|uniref:Outer membrane protein beta-barrel domain-containing protein n=1 Tax=Thermus arciformis TaxID=482827 RepID=A0A1G7E059_9DEIN|nr:hypothetical protein [Thermus arciformis]SDE57012.1 hypothetical protein SAMN04488243_10435 [Thermus arciformis]